MSVLIESMIALKDAETHKGHMNALVILDINFRLIAFPAQVLHTCLSLGTLL